jgi:hypothetical protein
LLNPWSVRSSFEIHARKKKKKKATADLIEDGDAAPSSAKARKENLGEGVQVLGFSQPRLPASSPAEAEARKQTLGEGVRVLGFRQQWGA